MQAFQHPSLGNILVTGHIMPASEAPFFLEVITQPEEDQPAISCIPVDELNKCFRLLKAAENRVRDAVYDRFIISRYGDTVELKYRPTGRR